MVYAEVGYSAGDRLLDIIITGLSVPRQLTTNNYRKTVKLIRKGRG